MVETPGVHGMEKDIVIEEQLVQPSMITPTLFVGLGGCGLRMVGRIKDHLSKRPDYEERYKGLTKFAGLDTNINDLEKQRQNMDDVFLISDFEKEEYAKLANGQDFLSADEYFTQWVPSNYRFRAGDTAGAGQIRIESRLGLYYQVKHGNIMKGFRRLIESLKDHSHGHRRLNSTEIRIVLCYSVAGGTGSGSHLPLAYLLRDIASQLGKPRLFGVAVLPSVFEDKSGRNKDGIFANGYAALKETEHLMKLGAPEAMDYPSKGLTFHYNPADPTKRVVRDQPFEFVYVIDRPERFTVDRVIDAAADGLYLQFFTPQLFGEQAGDYDNYTQHQRFLVPNDFEQKDVQGFTSFYGSYGAAVLLVPAEGLIDYCSRAAALDILRSSFLSQIPADTYFQTLRSKPDEFNTATIRTPDGGLRHIPASKLGGLTEAQRSEARDSLFIRRVRLLARAEADAGERALRTEFQEIWRHGHGESFSGPPREPSKDGEQAFQNREGDARAWGFKHSIVSALERYLGEVDPEGKDFDETSGSIYRGALRAYRSAHKRAQDSLLNEEALKNNPADVALRNMSTRSANARRDALQSMDAGSDDHPGFSSLIDLDFLENKDEAAGVNLRARRYAFLMLQKHPMFKWANEVLADGEPSERVNDEQFEETMKRSGIAIFGKNEFDNDAHSRNVDRVAKVAADLGRFSENVLKYNFATRVKKLHDSVSSYARRLAEMERGIDLVEASEEASLQKLLSSGSDDANQYVLDGEALQIENGMRLWDYFYEDKVAGRPEFAITQPILSQILSRQIQLSAKANSPVSGTRQLQQILEQISAYVASIIKPEIQGVHGSKNVSLRDGYTLDEALHDEVKYRALYLSNRDANSAQSREAVREILGEFKALSTDEQRELVSLSNGLHQDYLLDKISRIVKERAQVLCYYDNTRDQQGGVRPCKGFYASVNKEFAKSKIGQLFQNAPLEELKWIEDDVASPREVVFYRSILNVPLYVFGRMEALRNDYHQFRGMAQRPKILHIDKNWENTLQDLDPTAAIEFHRSQQLRRQIIGFSSLLVLPEVMDGPQDPFIAHSHADGPEGQEAYWILRRKPELIAGSGTPADHGSTEVSDSPYQRLGADLRESVSHLQNILNDNPIAYQPYQAMINAVARGHSPAVLECVCQQAIKWKTYHDSQRENYGGQPTAAQRRRLEDIREAYTRLAEALEDLRETLSDANEDRLSDMNRLPSSNSRSPLTPELERQSITQSIAHLDAFRQDWRAIMNPESSSAAPDVFRSLFGPVKAQAAE